MKQNINLYKKYQADLKKDKTVSAQTTYLVLLISVSLIIGVYGLRVAIETSILKGEIKATQLYLQNEDNKRRYDAVKKTENENQLLGSFQTSLKEINNVFSEKDSISGKVLSEIESARPSTLVIADMILDGPNAIIKFESDTAKDPSNFVRNLKGSDIIQSVEYKGYDYDATENKYLGSLTLILKGNF